MAKKGRSRRKRNTRRNFYQQTSLRNKRIRYARIKRLMDPYTSFHNVRRRKYKQYISTNNKIGISKGDRYRPKSEYMPRKSNRAWRNVNQDLKNYKQAQYEAIKTLEECNRRKTRRETLFAKKLTRKGSGAKKHKIRPESKIKC